MLTEQQLHACAEDAAAIADPYDALKGLNYDPAAVGGIAISLAHHIVRQLADGHSDASDGLPIAVCIRKDGEWYELPEDAQEGLIAGFLVNGHIWGVMTDRELRIDADGGEDLAVPEGW